MTAIGAHVTRGHRAYAERAALGLTPKPHIRFRPAARASLTVPTVITRADWRAMIRAEREQAAAQRPAYVPPARELSDEEIAKRVVKATLRAIRKNNLDDRRMEARAQGFKSLSKYHRALRAQGREVPW